MTSNMDSFAFAERLRGKFLVIDGPDGGGKSTQLRLLAKFLAAEGLEVAAVRDPGGTAIGDKIRAILLDRDHDEMSVACELMLYMASRAQLVAEVIRPALSRGQCVLCDRFISSTVAYQGAGGADVDAVRRVGDVAVGGLWPDLTVILDLGVEEGLRRAHARAASLDRMEAKGAEFHRKVRDLFLLQARENPRRFRVVDAAGEVEEVQARLRETVRRFFAK